MIVFQHKTYSIPSLSHHPLKFAQVLHKITLLHNKLFSPGIGQAKIPKFPVTGNNIRLLPINGDSDLTDGTLRNRI